MKMKLSAVFTIIAIFALLLVACSPEEPVDAPPAETPPPPDGEIPATGEEELMQIGEQVYAGQCAACHMEDGSGDGDLYPPLDDNPFVTGDPEAVIEIVLLGEGAMPAFGGVLTDEEAAGVVTYIRNAWTNDASVVTEEDVQAVR
jgi:mono/diheme cytochrome c family protein